MRGRAGLAHGRRTSVCRARARGAYKGVQGERVGAVRGVCGARTRREHARGVRGVTTLL